MPMVASTPSSAPVFWAMDSNHDELDMQLKDAQREAEREHNLRDAGHQDGPLEEPIILRNLLSEEQISQIFEEASADGVWPKGLYKDPASGAEQDSTTSTIGKSTVPQSMLKNELQSAPHHFAWSDGHVVLYMHNNNHWFVRTLPKTWCAIRGGMEARAWMDGAIPELDMDFLDGDVEDDPSMTQVRTVELHHYGVGGGLTTPGHRDTGSELTISVLLSDAEKVSGGDFVTYDKGVPIAHKMNRGDAILFNSESLHNISTITAGVRKSLVVELWPTARYR